MRGLLLLLGALAGSAVAQEAGAPEAGDPAAPTAVDALEIDLSGVDDATLSAEALRLERGDKLITARRYAEELLARRPDSMVAHFVMGQVYYEVEGNLPQALHHFGRARELYEGGEARGEELWRVHAQTLVAASQASQEMERYEYQLDLIAYHDSLYSPNMIGERSWPLMKLGRFEEARTAAEQAIASGDGWQASLGHNSLCALEALAGRRQAAREACDAALRHAQDVEDAADFTVDAYNAAVGSLGVLDFAAAEEMARLSARGTPLGVTNPYVILVDLLLGQGRGSEAVEALYGLQSWRAQQPPHLRDQGRAEADAALARTLLVAGRADKGMEVIDRAIRFPDRQGLFSGTGDQARGAHALIRLAMRRTAREVAAERASTRGLLTRLFRWLRDLLPDPDALADRATVRSVMTDRELALATFRVHFVDNGLLGLPPWMLGELIRPLGAGVVEELLRNVRKQEHLEGFEAYYDALEAEVAWVQGDERRALSLSDLALDALPEAEALLRARTAAVGAEAAWDSGDRSYALSRYETAMQLEPGVLRRLDLGLPAQIVLKVNADAAEEAADMLERSPRLRPANEGFQVTVGAAGPALRICLLTPLGNQLGCAQPELPEPEVDEETGEAPPPPSAEERARLAVDSFHEELFAMPLGLEAVDLRSLDGSTVLAEEQERQRLEGLLEGVGD